MVSLGNWRKLPNVIGLRTFTAQSAEARSKSLLPRYALIVRVALGMALLGLSLVGCGVNQGASSPDREGSAREATTPGAEADVSPATALPSEVTGVDVNRITFVSPEGDLFTIEPDGSNPRRLTGNIQVRARSTGPFMPQTVDFDNFFAWPTWSPDGSKLAASRVRVADNEAEISIQVFDAVTGRSQTVYDNAII